MDRRQNKRMLRQCPSGIAQRPPHHAIAVPTAMQNRVTKTMSVALPMGNNWSKRSPTLSLVQHHLHALDLFWASFFMRVQLTYLLLILPDSEHHKSSFFCPHHHWLEPPQWRPSEGPHSWGLQVTDCHPQHHMICTCALPFHHIYP